MRAARAASPTGLEGASIAGMGLPAARVETYLSKRNILRVEGAWGPMDRYRGVSTSGAGEVVVAGLELGNVFIGVQPLLGVEGDPMRLLFQEDSTPHPQYCAFYQWLKRDCKAQAVVHFGMQGDRRVAARGPDRPGDVSRRAHRGSAEPVRLRGQQPVRERPRGEEGLRDPHQPQRPPLREGGTL